MGSCKQVTRIIPLTSVEYPMNTAKLVTKVSGHERKTPTFSHATLTKPISEIEQVDSASLLSSVALIG